MCLKSKKQEDKYWEMEKFVKNVEFWHFEQNRDKGSNSFELPKEDGKRDTLFVNELSNILLVEPRGNKRQGGWEC